jgi:hypothetical protein
MPLGKDFFEYFFALVTAANASKQQDNNLCNF